jgi:hypothetical protein
MKFYRLQSEDYDINERSKSFWTCYDDMVEAMEEDIKEWIIGYQPDENWIELDSCAVQNEAVKTLYNNCLNISKLWNELVNKGYEPRRVHKGLSCYSEDRKEQLKDYFEYHRPVNSKNMVDAYNNDYYILVFAGENVGTGLDGEDLAVFEKELKRITVKDFVNSLGNE